MVQGGKEQLVPLMRAHSPPSLPTDLWAGANAHSQQVTFSLTADISHAPHPRIQCDLGGGNGRVCLERVARGSMKLGCYGGRWTPRCWTTRRLPATHRSRWAKWSFACATCSQWGPQDKIWTQRSLPLGTLTGSLQQSWGFLWWLINITGTPTH